MNSISKLIKAKTISFNEMMIRYYRFLNLTEQEAMILMILFMQLDEEDEILSIKRLLQKVSLNEENLSLLLLMLIQKGYIELTISEDGKERFNLDKCIELLGDVASGANDFKRDPKEDLLNDIVAFLENTFQRNLNSNDLKVINNWLDLNYTLEEVKDAILASLRARKSNINYVDAILANKHKEKPKEEVDEEIKQLLDSVYVKRK